MPPLLGRALAIAVLAAAVAVAVGGCGDQSRGGVVPGDTLTIYSSLPLQGPHAGQAQSIINGEKLALHDAGGKAGDFKVNFVSRDDATAGDSRSPGWHPGRTADNATKAAEDSRTIAYIGDFDSGASAISIPITNEAGFAQVSPAATAVGLTKLVRGADKGEPDKFYPSGDRTFARLVPADDVQASGAASWAKALGAHRVFLLDDKGVASQGLVEQFDLAADRLGLEIVGRKGMDPRSDDYRGLTEKIRKSNPDLIYFGGSVESNALRLWQDLHAGVPRARLMGSGGLVVPEFYERLGDAAGATYLTSAAEDTSQLPPLGQRFLRDYHRQFGGNADSYAAYGHAAMSLLLDAIRRAGKDASKRGDVITKLFETRSFKSVIGSFSIDENGDTSITTMAGYRIRRGQLSFARSLAGR